jgi:hypothetical protein
LGFLSGEEKGRIRRRGFIYLRADEETPRRGK